MNKQRKVQLDSDGNIRPVGYITLGPLRDTILDGEDPYQDPIGFAEKQQAEANKDYKTNSIREYDIAIPKLEGLNASGRHHGELEPGEISVALSKASTVVRWQSGGYITTSGLVVGKLKRIDREYKRTYRPGSSSRRVAWINDVWDGIVPDLGVADVKVKFNVLEGLNLEALQKLQEIIKIEIGMKLGEGNE